MEEIIFQYPFRNITTLKKWCIKNGVVILNQDKILYVYKFEFELAFHHEYIEKIKLKYPENWQIYFDSIQNNDFSGFLDINDESNLKTINNRSYKNSDMSEQIKNDLLKKIKN